MTITTPWRRITLQLSQRGFTDARTFTLSLLTYDDATPGRRWGHAHRIEIATVSSLEANDQRRKLQR